jgi:hypothetical protein
MRRPGGDQTTAVPAALSAPPTIHIISADSGRAKRINMRLYAFVLYEDVLFA